MSYRTLDAHRTRQVATAILGLVENTHGRGEREALEARQATSSRQSGSGLAPLKPLIRRRQYCTSAQEDLHVVLLSLLRLI